jgi:hypothetical protein
VLDWLGGGGPVPDVTDEDPFTVPLALAAHGSERTLSILDDEDDAADRDGEPEPWAPPHRPGPLERLRRGALWTALLGAGGAALTAYPWLGLFSMLALAWFLRSASLAATATGDRRRLRGAKWYDPVLYLLGAPWHVVRAIPGTILLALWSIGLATAAALVCYAVAADLETSLFVIGLTFTLALSLGPGGSRVRSPVARVVRRSSGRLGTWLVALLAVGAVGAVSGLLVASAGVNWEPGSEPSPPLPVEWGIPVR